MSAKGLRPRELHQPCDGAGRHVATIHPAAECQDQRGLVESQPVRHMQNVLLTAVFAHGSILARTSTTQSASGLSGAAPKGTTPGPGTVSTDPRRKTPPSRGSNHRTSNS